MNRPEILLKRFASFVRSMRPTPPKYNVEDVLNSTSGHEITDRFIDLYYTTGIASTHWRGHELLKNPCDLWVYIELMQEIRPSIIIETGTHHGASALYYSDMAKLLNIKTKVITIDINPKINFDLDKANIISLKGISTSKPVIKSLQEMINPSDNVLIMLDSDHSKKNVLEELNLYSEFVNPGSYIIVEDSIVNGHPTFPSHGPGPFEAVEEFLKTRTDFEVDMMRQKFLLTYNNRGYLKRIK